MASSDTGEVIIPLSQESTLSIWLCLYVGSKKPTSDAATLQNT